MDSLKFPLEFDIYGFKKLTDGSDEYYKQMMSIAALTEPGVLKITPDFGVYDPTFNMADRGQFVINASRYVPEIQILQVENIIDQQGNSTISFSFRRRQ